ncbi:MAG: sigma-70 family RNA polymerase sigma factor [Pseudomonadota bacterium]|nr:sigma-70 family RNA polymerase sigma factor [Pseudomonadota bacterium]
MRASEQELRAWMLGGLDGDAGAYRRLLDALATLLRTFFGRRLRGADAAVEDLVQDSLIAIHTRRASYDTARPFTAWAYAIARYKLIDHFRRQRVTVPVEGLEDMLAVEGFEDAVAAKMDVADLLATLPPKQAAAIHDTRIAGLSIAEAAVRHGISESDVKISVHRGLKTLAARLEGER